jgi:ribosomal protein S18 acetylase RimI-like enzyme
MHIAPLQNTPDIVEKLAALLVETVADGGSVSFRHPLAPEAASRFWQNSLAAAVRGERVVLGAWAGPELAGTVTVVLDMPENQPHRAEIAKLMVFPAHRGQGLARALMLAAEAVAREHGKSHLLLDTATDGGAAALYAGLGYHFVGEIPHFALKPHGGLTGTRLYWKQIAPLG